MGKLTKFFYIISEIVLLGSALSRQLPDMCFYFSLLQAPFHWRR